MKKFIFISIVAIIMLFVNNKVNANIPTIDQQYKITDAMVYDNVGRSNYTFKDAQEFYEEICISMEEDEPGALLVFEKKSLKQLKGSIQESLWNDLVKIITKEGKFHIFIYQLSKDVIPEKEFEHIIPQYDFDSTLIIIKKL